MRDAEFRLTAACVAIETTTLSPRHCSHPIWCFEERTGARRGSRAAPGPAEQASLRPTQMKRMTTKAVRAEPRRKLVDAQAVNVMQCDECLRCSAPHLTVRVWTSRVSAGKEDRETDTVAGEAPEKGESKRVAWFHRRADRRTPQSDAGHTLSTLASEGNGDRWPKISGERAIAGRSWAGVTALPPHPATLLRGVPRGPTRLSCPAIQRRSTERRAHSTAPRRKTGR